MVTGGNVQIVWKKFLRYFDVDPRIVPLKSGNYRLTAEHLDRYVDENTICVVAIGDDDALSGHLQGQRPSSKQAFRKSIASSRSASWR
jgi:glutamate decarboxylase